MNAHFCILFHARTGSTLLCQGINTHPELIALGEPFNPDGVALTLDRHDRRRVLFALGRPEGPELKARRDADPLGLLDRLMEGVQGDRPLKGIGFKLSFLHDRSLPDDRMLHQAIFADPRFKKIVLERDNLLAMFSSTRLAEQNRVYHITSDANAAGFGLRLRDDLGPQKVTMPFHREAFDAFAVKVRRLRDEAHSALARAGTPFLSVEYREVVDRSVYPRLADFLGVQDRFDAAATNLQKMNTKDILSRFENPDDVRQAADDYGHPEWAGPEY